MTKNLFYIFLLTSSFLISSGQTTTIDYSFTFLKFKPTDLGIATDKLTFLKNNSLDTTRSKSYLDSLVDLLTKNPNLTFEISRKAGYTFKFCSSTKSSQEQSQKLIDYLASKKIDANRLANPACSSLPKVSQKDIEEAKQNQKKNKLLQTWTVIHIINRDYK